MNELMTLILTCGLTYLCGIGTGAVLNELINKMKGEKHEKMDNTRG